MKTGQSDHIIQAVIAQLAARRSHNPKVVSSILTHRSWRLQITSRFELRSSLSSAFESAFPNVCCLRISFACFGNGDTYPFPFCIVSFEFSKTHRVKGSLSALHHFLRVFMKCGMGVFSVQFTQDGLDVVWISVHGFMVHVFLHIVWLPDVCMLSAWAHAWVYTSVFYTCVCMLFLFFYMVSKFLFISYESFIYLCMFSSVRLRHFLCAHVFLCFCTHAVNTMLTSFVVLQFKTLVFAWFMLISTSACIHKFIINVFMFMCFSNIC